MIDSKTSEETGVGNYFISNYPQYSFWKPDFVSDVHDVLNSPSPSNPLQLGFYFHITLTGKIPKNLKNTVTDDIKKFFEPVLQRKFFFQS